MTGGTAAYRTTIGESMKKLLKIVMLMLVVGAVAGAVASFIAKKRLETMSDDEIRAYLASKLEGRVGQEQLATIQEATVAGIRKGRASTDAVTTITQRATETAEDAVEDVATA
ncbi:MAG: hypothetical protein DWP92_02655 [Armatimonadetes bacterium]|nr:MAG: hypothetical protein DWP92_02655 [Armatimonadota bacterium]